jgi:hypothetical protein
MLTQDQAKALLDAHDIISMLNDDEEMELLEDNNPELAEAYYALHRIAYGAKDAGDPVNANAPSNARGKRRKDRAAGFASA